MACKLCNLDINKIENTILEETENLCIKPAMGSFVDGYVLVITKKHINSMSDLDKQTYCEYKEIIKKYREKFNKIYNKYPIVFEHGEPILNSEMKANSITHAHTHIINYNFKNEREIIEKLNLQKINDIEEVTNKRNYIMYINEEGNIYVTYNFEPISQMMRRLIAKDLNCEDKYDWRINPFMDNIKLTINKLRNNEQ